MTVPSSILATERGGAKLAQSLARVPSPLPDPALQGGDHEVPVTLGDLAPPLLDVLLGAVAHSRCVELLYAGEGARTGTARVVQPHQVVGFAGRTYLAAWCERVEDWRHFRVDRIIDALPTERTFTPREDFTPIDGPASVFREPDGGADDVTVNYSAAIARWILERYPDAERQEDGSVSVTYRVADVDWLVRRVLQYGPEAEVVEPEAYREAVRRAVGG